MGLFKKKEVQPVLWPKEKKGNTLMFRYPGSCRAGQNVIVSGKETALLISYGAVKKVYSQPGQWPLVSDGDVIFVSTKQFEGKFGTKQPLVFNDPRFDMVHLRAFGEFKYNVSDPIAFVDEVSENNDSIDVQMIEDIVRDEIVMALNQSLGYLKSKAGMSVGQIPQNLNKIGNVTVKAGKKSFKKLGLCLSDISELYINPPPNVKKAIEEVSQVSAYTDEHIMKKTKLAVADAMRDAASSGGSVNIGRIGNEQNINTTIKDSVLQRSNIGVGGGGSGGSSSGSSTTVIEDSVVQRSEIGTTGGSEQSEGTAACHKCGSSIQSGWVACPACGTKVQNNCVNCGSDVQPGWVACPACGNKLQ